LGFAPAQPNLRLWYDWSAEADRAFRYPDLTSCVEFTLEMTQTALEGLDHRSGQRCSLGVQGFSLDLPIQG